MCFLQMLDGSKEPKGNDKLEFEISSEAFSITLNAFCTQILSIVSVSENLVGAEQLTSSRDPKTSKSELFCL